MKVFRRQLSGGKQKQQRNKFEKAVYQAKLVIASGKSPTATKKGPGRKHVQGYSIHVKEFVRGWGYLL